MLKLNKITKIYETDSLKQAALNNISVSFRKSEFVSILGHSGSGKTTLLNIVGGLDQYTSGDLIINGKSTKAYSETDWDTYRNHSIGFVFQTYNLIPHQSVLSNVELALTLSGVSKSECRTRAKDALERVGLADHVHKNPNQLSGGQMQRVAIARALVNNPDILLADEPTGALDSETSIQIMEMLKDISKDKLVIMVTHNPELAEKYSTRIVRLSDGKITDDSNPHQEGNSSPIIVNKKIKRQIIDKKKPSMSFLTALSLSLNNLMTKKARTFLTSFAGSIGIIGIALILSVSSGFQAYIDRVQEDTLSSYPIIIEAESTDMASMLESIGNFQKENEIARQEPDAVYENSIIYDLLNSMSSAGTTINNMAKFKTYLETNEELQSYLSGYQYSYDIDFNIHIEDEHGNIVKPDITQLFGQYGDMSQFESSRYNLFSSFSVWEEMLSDKDGQLVSETLKEQYEVVAGRWPSDYDEVVLIIDKNNEVSDLVLYTLGLKSTEEMQDIMMKAQLGEQIDTNVSRHWSYDEILDMSFKLILNSEYYQKNTDETYVDLASTEAGIEYLFNNQDIGTTLKISGIIRANDSSASPMMSGSIGYTKALTDNAMNKTSSSEIVRAQLDNMHIDIISGLPFTDEDNNHLTDVEITEKVKSYFASLSKEEKAALYIDVASEPSDEYLESVVSQQLSPLDRQSLESLMIETYAESMGITDTSSVESYIKSMDEESLFATAAESFRDSVKTAYSDEMRTQLENLDTETLATMLDNTEFTQKDYSSFYDIYIPSDISESTFEDNLRLLGYASIDSPSVIKLYASSFENKDEISQFIEEYNTTVDEQDAIAYTDYVALLMSSITTIINAISYVLIAFVAISLIVSSIMIGIITYISVLERTKEIGILRAIGASKKDVARVFNAETIIVGFGSGAMGIGISLLLLIPINIILHNLTGIEILSAQLPINGAVSLVVISILLTFIAGLIPSGIAAKKNPVEALRTE